jgi:hypothetical protein
MLLHNLGGTAEIIPSSYFGIEGFFICKNIFYKERGSGYALKDRNTIGIFY